MKTSWVVLAVCLLGSASGCHLQSVRTLEGAWMVCEVVLGAIQACRAVAQPGPIRPGRPAPVECQP